jgi:pSer/pThr/pTyr-binding forkhead associated (FHA) protein
MTTRANPIDRLAAAQQSTAALDAIDRPEDGQASPDGVPAPGCYLVIEQNHERRTVALSRSVTHIGRGFAATLQLEDAGVSRRHAIVVQRRSGARILDDRSANGTWVNGRRVFDAELHNGDVIVVGRVLLVYVEVVA